MIKIKSVLANFGSEKQFKVKKGCFITIEIDLIGPPFPVVYILNGWPISQPKNK